MIGVGTGKGGGGGGGKSGGKWGRGLGYAEKADVASRIARRQEAQH